MQDNATVFLNAPALKVTGAMSILSTDTIGIVKAKIFDKLLIKPANQTIVYDGLVMGPKRMTFYQVSAWHFKTFYVFDRFDKAFICFWW